VGGILSVVWVTHHGTIGDDWRGGQGKMSRFKKMLLGAMLLLLLAVAGLFIYKDSIVRAGIISGGDQVLGADSTRLDSASIDLFGAEFSTNAANYFTAGLKGRYREEKIDDDHVLTAASYPVQKLEDGVIGESEEAALTVINERLRDDYIEDCEKGIGRWNRTITEHGIDHTLSLPHRAFQRAIGQFREAHFSPVGAPVSETEWRAGQDQWLPSDAERAHVVSLMQRVVEPGKFASWIAPPRRGVNGQPIDFDYVHLD